MKAKYVYPNTDKEVENNFLQDIYINLENHNYRIIVHRFWCFLIIDDKNEEIVAELWIK